MKVGKHTYGIDCINIKKWSENDGQLLIGSFCAFASNVEIFLGGNHRIDWFTTYPFGHGLSKNVFTNFDGVGHPASKGDVIIGNDVWVGDGSIIMSGVEICDGAVIAAKSVITKKIGPYEIWGGNPAKMIKKRFDDETINFLLKLKWWNLEDEDINKISPILCSNDIEKLKSLNIINYEN